MNEFQPGVVVSKEKLNAHGKLAATRYTPWPDMVERHARIAGQRLLVKLTPEGMLCPVCGEPYCDVEAESAERVLPGWIGDGVSGAGICSSLVRTD